MYEILKSKQGWERKQLKMRKATENAKKRSCVNILLNMAGITQPLLGIATAGHSHFPQTDQVERTAYVKLERLNNP